MKVFIGILVLLVFRTTGSAQEQVEYDPVVVDCLNLVIPGPRQFVINSPQDFEVVKKLRRSFPMQFLPAGEKCSDLSAFDFSRKTLVGYVASVGGCYEPTFNLNFHKNRNEYFVEVLVGPNGSCSAMFTKDYWLVTEKISDPNLVHFITKYE